MSRTYLDWARRNLDLNGLAGPNHAFVHADCLSWLDERAKEGGPSYGLVFVDPPTLSRSKRMDKEFDVQRDHVALLHRIGEVLEPDGTILFSNNYQRFRLDTDGLADFEVKDITRATIPEDFRRNPKIHVAYLLKRRALAAGSSSDVAGPVSRKSPRSGG
jgi:23S rRNA (guanine2445-N2)-methyltransferase / 23S rRNA (guanine2069-N7)-methyltransferase